MVSDERHKLADETDMKLEVDEETHQKLIAAGPNNLCRHGERLEEVPLSSN